MAELSFWADSRRCCACCSCSTVPWSWAFSDSLSWSLASSFVSSSLCLAMTWAISISLVWSTSVCIFNLTWLFSFSAFSSSASLCRELTLLSISVTAVSCLPFSCWSFSANFFFNMAAVSFSDVSLMVAISSAWFSFIIDSCPSWEVFNWSSWVLLDCSTCFTCVSKLCTCFWRSSLDDASSEFNLDIRSISFSSFAAASSTVLFPSSLVAAKASSYSCLICWSFCVYLFFNNSAVSFFVASLPAKASSFSLVIASSWSLWACSSVDLCWVASVFSDSFRSLASFTRSSFSFFALSSWSWSVESCCTCRCSSPTCLFLSSSCCW